MNYNNFKVIKEMSLKNQIEMQYEIDSQFSACVDSLEV